MVIVFNEAYNILLEYYLFSCIIFKGRVSIIPCATLWHHFGEAKIQHIDPSSNIHYKVYVNDFTHARAKSLVLVKYEMCENLPQKLVFMKRK